MDRLRAREDGQDGLEVGRDQTHASPFDISFQTGDLTYLLKNKNYSHWEQ